MTFDSRKLILQRSIQFDPVFRFRKPSSLMTLSFRSSSDSIELGTESDPAAVLKLDAATFDPAATLSFEFQKVRSCSDDTVVFCSADAAMFYSAVLVRYRSVL